MHKRIGAFLVAALCLASMNACSRLPAVSRSEEEPAASRTDSQDAAPSQDASMYETTDPGSTAAALTLAPAVDDTAAVESAVPTTASEAPSAPVARTRTAQNSEELQKMAQCVLLGGYAATFNDPTQIDPDMLRCMLYELYTLYEVRKYSTDGEAPQAQSQSLIDFAPDAFGPVVQNVMDAARDVSSDRYPSGVWFSAPTVYAVYKAIVDCTLTEEEFYAQACADDELTKDGGFLYPSSESSYTRIYYADRMPFPHQDNNTYLFRIVNDTAGGWHDLYRVTVEPAPDSPFGWHVVSSANETADYGEELMELARDFSYHPDGFIFPDSDTRLLTAADFERLYYELGTEIGGEQYILAYARNELFARHGNIFDTPAYREFFSCFDWYNPTHKVDTSEFNQIELANLDTIIALEKEA